MSITKGGQGRSDADTLSTGVGLIIVYSVCLAALGVAWLVCKVLV